MDLDAIKNAEAQVANIQAALDDAQRVLQAAERAQLAAERAHQVAEQSTQVMRTVALAAIAGLVVVALTVRRSHHAGTVTTR
jgi:multidrug efflux pump subunit AcrB